MKIERSENVFLFVLLIIMIVITMMMVVGMITKATHFRLCQCPSAHFKGMYVKYLCFCFCCCCFYVVLRSVLNVNVEQ